MRKVLDFIDRLLEEVTEALSPSPELEPIPVRVNDKRRHQPRR